MKNTKSTKVKIPTRLAPKPNVLRRLYLLSGNLCAYPECTQVMVDSDGDFVGQVCHIEAAEPGGPRYNPELTPEDRRDESNLLLLCANHHKKTDNIELFPVSELRRMKNRHEAKFLGLTKKIAESLVDGTEAEVTVFAENLKRMDSVLNWNSSDEELAESVRDLRRHVGELKNVPVAIREFLAKVAIRIYKMKKFPVVSNSSIGVSDIEKAFDLSKSALKRRCEELEQYGLGAIEELDSHGPLQYVVTIYSINGWDFWIELAKFCKKTDTNMDEFWRNLDFSALDH